jgi:hypothetical protein
MMASFQFAVQGNAAQLLLNETAFSIALLIAARLQHGDGQSSLTLIDYECLTLVNERPP